MDGPSTSELAVHQVSAGRELISDPTGRNPSGQVGFISCPTDLEIKVSLLGQWLKEWTKMGNQKVRRSIRFGQSEFLSSQTPGRVFKGGRQKATELYTRLFQPFSCRKTGSAKY